ncbi:hypothetical protein CK203_114781 [Vitis vinifera]|uniref:Reverse transcriptase zinc-binding domain-containing protein n=1 Tax=Vitis vinifera TaxID=29760 RepID=A0A438BPE3_VITVI|nr:hypothetical protein CK203_114781 [Vitis vinifera]
MEDPVGVLGCKVGVLLTTYLGLLLGAPFKSSRVWDEVIVSKYKQEERGWCTKEAREGCGVGVWKAIRGGWEAFKDRTVFKVVDVWDESTWSPRSFPSSMSNRRAEVFPYGTIWEATWGRIMTLDQLKRRGWKIPNRCYMCKEEEEMIDYIHLYSLKAGKKRKKPWKVLEQRVETLERELDAAITAAARARSEKRQAEAAQKAAELRSQEITRELENTTTPSLIGTARAT